jgi:alkyldihydroxyacetonephosphate synthase
LCRLPGSLTLAAAEAWLSQQGHTLGIEADALASRCDLSVNDWIAEGLVGLRTRYADPVGVRLSGFTARLRNGRRITLPAAPRRAVGPDLSALFAGAGGDFGSIESATLGAPPAAAHAPPLSAFSRSEPPLNDGELAALARLRRALEA